MLVRNVVVRNNCLTFGIAACSSLSWDLLIQTSSHSTLHFLGSSAIHPPSVKSMGWTVVEIIEGQMDRKTDRQRFLPLLNFQKISNITIYIDILKNLYRSPWLYSYHSPLMSCAYASPGFQGMLQTKSLSGHLITSQPSFFSRFLQTSQTEYPIITPALRLVSKLSFFILHTTISVTFCAYNQVSSK